MKDIRKVIGLLLCMTICCYMTGEEKKNLTVPDLLEQFTKASGDEFANDRAILS